MCQGSGVETRYKEEASTPSIGMRILEGALRERPREVIRQSCAERDVHIVKGVLARDHVHMFFSVPPKLALATVMQRSTRVIAINDEK